MNKGKLSTDPYKGVRDFYPKEMSIQSYIFDIWTKTATSFGFERYDASILEPSELYKSKGAANEEIVNGQTYTFTDRGDREVTLRPEMTPTAARMVAAKSRELKFPLRWYSLPNLFRYERPQRGRLREHWQFNCDIFGSTAIASDVEVIAMAHQLMLNFGATPEMFEIILNDRKKMTTLYNEMGILDESVITALTRLNDKKNKISGNVYKDTLLEILKDEKLVEKMIAMMEDAPSDNQVLHALKELGITNVRIDRTLARGFDYYTGTIFELVDLHPDNKRSLLGGGRYDNLTEMFGGEPIPGIGFGMGDVTMKDFLETHSLLPKVKNSGWVQLMVIPTEENLNLEAEKVASIIRQNGVSVVTDIGTKKLGKKIADASENKIPWLIIAGTDEVAAQEFTLKNLASGTEETGSLPRLIDFLTNNLQ